MTVLDRPRAVPSARFVRSGWTTSALIALATGLLRLPFVHIPLERDEGGYLLVAAQWRPGTSTYGNYFVDRPPLLMGIFWLADVLGGTTALRVIGIVVVVGSVLLAARIGGRWAALTAAVFLSTPIFGTAGVDGELLAVPFVLAGVLLTVRSVAALSASYRWWALAAGGCAAAAVLVKQNMVDVIVFALVALGIHALRGNRRAAALRAAWFCLGGALVLGTALAVAASRGTSAPELWDALVTFRAQAGSVIRTFSTSATTARFHVLLLSLAVSCAPLVGLAALASARRPSRGVDLRWAGGAMLTWELAGAALGGSYWLHYLIAVVPGLVVLVTAALPPRGVAGEPGRSALGEPWVRSAIGVAAVSAAVAFTGLCVHPPKPGVDQQVAAYVRAHSMPDDGMVVAFGASNIVRDAGLQSPYEHLWSLPVRVRDPRLSELAAVMGSARAPRWVVVDGGSLATWGVDASRAQRVLEAHYREVTRAGDWHVFERR